MFLIRDKKAAPMKRVRCRKKNPRFSTLNKIG
jgi:hypothetical protein